MQTLEVSGAVRPLYGSLGVKGLKSKSDRKHIHKNISSLTISLSQKQSHMALE